jgi:hypothetical protein
LYNLWRVNQVFNFRFEGSRVLGDPASDVARELEERLRFETLIADLSSRFARP